MSQIWDIYCKHCLWSIFGPCWCTKSCKTTFYAHLSRIWKLARFTRFIRKVFATKILLSGQLSLFATLPPSASMAGVRLWKMESSDDWSFLQVHLWLQPPEKWLLHYFFALLFTCPEQCGIPTFSNIFRHSCLCVCLCPCMCHYLYMSFIPLLWFSCLFRHLPTFSDILCGF